MMWDPEDCVFIARSHGYTIEQHQSNICLLIAVIAKIEGAVKA